MIVDRYRLANVKRCTAHRQHRMVNQGRSETHAADLYRCDCGETALGNTDEHAARWGLPTTGPTTPTALHDHPCGDTTCPECWTPERRTESETR